MSDKRRSDDFGFGIVAYKDRPNRCFECGEMTKGLHHVVPVVRGGTKQLPMCERCHNLAHDCNVIQSATIRAGLEKAKSKGITLGAPVKVDLEAAKTILKLKSEGFSIRKISEATGLSVGSVHKVTSNPEGQEFFTKTMTFK